MKPSGRQEHRVLVCEYTPDACMTFNHQPSPHTCSAAKSKIFCKTYQPNSDLGKDEASNPEFYVEIFRNQKCSTHPLRITLGVYYITDSLRTLKEGWGVILFILE